MPELNGGTIQDLLKDYLKYNTESGSANINLLTGSHKQLRARFMPSLSATTQTAHWPANSDIRYLLAIAVREANTSFAVGTATDEPYAILTIDAASDAEAAVNIGASGTAGAPPAALTTDSQAIIIPLNMPTLIPLEDALTNGLFSGGRLDARCSSNTAGEFIDLWIGAN